MSDKYAALKQAAEKAISEEGDIWWDQEQLTRYPDTLEIPGTEANFIEEASPATILELLAERDADKRRIEELERLRDKVSDPRVLPRRKEWISGQQYSYVLLENVKALVDEACDRAGISLKIEGE